MTLRWLLSKIEYTTTLYLEHYSPCSFHSHFAVQLYCVIISMALCNTVLCCMVLCFMVWFFFSSDPYSVGDGQGAGAGHRSCSHAGTSPSSFQLELHSWRSSFPLDLFTFVLTRVGLFIFFIRAWVEFFTFFILSCVELFTLLLVGLKAPTN